MSKEVVCVEDEGISDFLLRNLSNGSILGYAGRGFKKEGEVCIEYDSFNENRLLDELADTVNMCDMYPEDYDAEDTETLKKLRKKIFKER